ncbi:MAG: hypothetical protein SFV15_08660 [Polyangiaceae bacterium]|nr:hypothetical protein [Polyangiaceae bacterium]
MSLAVSDWTNMCVLIRLSVLCLFLATANAAWAKSPASIQQAETAYREVDFSRTREVAKEALSRGSHKPRDTERLYFLLAMSAAALGEEDEAKAAFTALIGINPDTRLEKSLSPKLRGPYAEALGFWKSIDEKLDARATFSDDQKQLIVEVTDPADMVRALGVRSRRAGGRYTATKVKVVKGEPVIVSIPSKNAPREFLLVLLDEHGNALRTVGTAARPIQLPPRQTSREPIKTALEKEPSGAKGSTGRFLGSVVLTLGAVGAGAAVPFHLDREDKASQWNSAACEAPLGRSRGDQCAGIERDMNRSEQRMLILYGAGGALMAGGLVTLLLSSPPSAERASSRFGCMLGATTVHCSASF